MRGVEAEAKFAFRMPERDAADGGDCSAFFLLFFSSEKGCFFSLSAHFVGLKFNRMGADS